MGAQACVTRERPDGGPKNGWELQEKISLDDCIRAYTSDSAYAQFEEGKKGELKPGEYADFVILIKRPHQGSPAGAHQNARSPDHRWRSHHLPSQLSLTLVGSASLTRTETDFACCSSRHRNVL
jgi:predicted amidohydrolase